MIFRNACRALRRVRMNAGAFVVDNTFRALALLGRMHPNADPKRHRVEVIRDLPYSPGGRAEHRLDVYRPLTRPGPYPVVLYTHGGGFRFLSKDTHWIMALAFARRGWLVINVSYRLAPRHPYPAAVQDACAAYVWAIQHAHEYGGDVSRLVLAGESAGANLATSLAIAACQPRPEPWARAVYDTGVVPLGVMPACGMLQVSDPGRFLRRRKMSQFMVDRIEEVTDAYLRRVDHNAPGGIELADPVVLLEGEQRFDRPLPRFYAPVGTKDPLLDDTRRLKAALDKRGVPCQASYFPGEIHAFHALLWRPAAIRHWRETYQFLNDCLTAAAARTPAAAAS